MARVYLHPILNRSTGHKLDSMKRMVDEFELDGVILHSDRSCKPYSLEPTEPRVELQVQRMLGAIHRSLVGRVVSMVRNVGIVAPLMLSGGVAQNEAVRTMIAEATVEDVILPGEPQLMGAYGAALLGA